MAAVYTIYMFAFTNCIFEYLLTAKDIYIKNYGHVRYS